MTGSGHLKGTNMTPIDAGIISFWLGLPSVVRIFTAVGVLLGAGWTARGTLSEMRGHGARITRLEAAVPALQGDVIKMGLTVDNNRQKSEAGLMYLMCRVSMTSPNSKACDYIVRDYPEFMAVIRLQSQPANGAR